MLDPAAVLSLGGRCTIGGRVGRGFAVATRPMVDVTTMGDAGPVLLPIGLRECEGAAKLAPFASTEEMLAFAFDGEALEYVGPVREGDVTRRTRTTVAVWGVAMEGWVQFAATGPVP